MSWLPSLNDFPKMRLADCLRTPCRSRDACLTRKFLFTLLTPPTKEANRAEKTLPRVSSSFHADVAIAHQLDAVREGDDHPQRVRARFQRPLGQRRQPVVGLDRTGAALPAFHGRPCGGEEGNRGLEGPAGSQRD